MDFITTKVSYSEGESAFRNYETFQEDIRSDAEATVEDSLRANSTR